MKSQLDRRAFIRAMGVTSTCPRLFAEESNVGPAVQKEIRIAVIGVGSRGTYLLERSLDYMNIKVSAVCDIVEERATRAQEIVQKTKGYRPSAYTRGPEVYKKMLERDDIDAVLIMTPWNQHTPQAIASMRAGKHVGSETPPAWTVDECWQLVETKEETGRHYMLLENYPYSRAHMMILKMAHTNVFGEITYGECS